jgi:hypothetical protein
MRAKKFNQLSRRRTRRPDGGIYRDLRRLRSHGPRRRRQLIVALALLILGVILWRSF